MKTKLILALSTNLARNTLQLTVAFAAILAVLLLVGCSTVTQYTDPDGRQVFTATNVLDESDRQIAANMAAGGSAEMTFPAAIFGPDGDVVGIGAGTLAMNGPGTLTYVEGGDRTGFAKDFSRAYFSFKGIREFFRADVAKHSETERTARAAISEDGSTRRAGISAVQSLGNNPEGAGTDVIRSAGSAVR